MKETTAQKRFKSIFCRSLPTIVKECSCLQIVMYAYKTVDGISSTKVTDTIWGNILSKVNLCCII